MVAITMISIEKVTIHMWQFYKRLDQVKQAQRQSDGPGTPGPVLSQITFIYSLLTFTKTSAKWAAFSQFLKA